MSTSQQSVWVAKPKWILCDIEGTTTSITFVKDVLFPYVRDHLREYLRTTWTSSETQEDIASLWRQYVEDSKGKPDRPFPVGLADFTQHPSSAVADEATLEAISSYVFWAMDRDQKTTALKQLQGNIWRSAYQSGSIKAHVYEDVPRCFEKWSQQENIQLAIYSSGSMLAQKLLFDHTEAGNLSKYISNYFDTTIGGKQEAASYKRICSALGAPPCSVLFLTDSRGEALTATEAALTVLHLARDEQEVFSQEEEFPCQSVNTFDQIAFHQQ